MAQKIDLIYRLKGPLVEEGIDVFELSPLLLSLGEVIQDSQEIAHPGGHKLGVNVKPFQKGSFIVELSVFARTNLQQLVEVVNSAPIKEIKELIDWLGIASSGTTVVSVGVIKLYQFLKGRPKKIEEIGPEEVRVVARDDKSVTVNKKVIALFQNNKIQQNIYNIYGNFLGREGVESVESFIKDEKAKPVIVTKSDVPYFNPANAEPIEQNEDEHRNITRVFLNPKRVSLEGEPDNWSLRKGTDVIITATIKDQDFLEKVKSAEIRLAYEDLLEVDLVETQIIKGTEAIVKYEVIKVIKYQKAPVQTTLLT